MVNTHVSVNGKRHAKEAPGVVADKLDAVLLQLAIVAVNNIGQELLDVDPVLLHSIKVFVFESRSSGVAIFIRLVATENVALAKYSTRTCRLLRYLPMMPCCCTLLASSVAD